MGAMAYFFIVLIMLGGVVGGYFLVKSGGGFSDKNNSNDKDKDDFKIYTGYIIIGFCGLIAFIMLIPIILEGIARMFGYIIAVSIYDSFN